MFTEKTRIVRNLFMVFQRFAPSYYASFLVMSATLRDVSRPQGILLGRSGFLQRVVVFLGEDAFPI